MALTKREIEDITDDVANLRAALTKRAFLSDQAALAMVTAAMPAIVTAATEVTRFGPDDPPELHTGYADDPGYPSSHPVR